MPTHPNVRSATHDFATNLRVGNQDAPAMFGHVPGAVADASTWKRPPSSATHSKTRGAADGSMLRFTSGCPIHLADRPVALHHLSRVRWGLDGHGVTRQWVPRLLRWIPAELWTTTYRLTPRVPAKARRLAHWATDAFDSHRLLRVRWPTAITNPTGPTFKHKDQSWLRGIGIVARLTIEATPNRFLEVVQLGVAMPSQFTSRSQGLGILFLLPISVAWWPGDGVGSTRPRATGPCGEQLAARHQSTSTGLGGKGGISLARRRAESRALCWGRSPIKRLCVTGLRRNGCD
jgi:hypothetical protein